MYDSVAVASEPKTGRDLRFVEAVAVVIIVAVVSIVSVVYILLVVVTLLLQLILLLLWRKHSLLGGVSLFASRVATIYF